MAMTNKSSASGTVAQYDTCQRHNSKIYRTSLLHKLSLKKCWKSLTLTYSR